MPRLGLAVLMPALAPGDAAWEWDVMARSISAGTGTEASASSPFLETPAPAAPLREEPWEGRCCEGNRLGWVLFGVGVGSAACRGKQDEEQRW